MQNVEKNGFCNKGGFSLHQRMEERNERDALGRLPQYAPLANPYVPFQQTGAATYPAKRGIVRGTLFPGLDLPFMDMVNDSELSDRPLHELQALSFSIVELGMYLDTHREDEAAVQLFREYVKLYNDGMQRYEAAYGPLVQRGAGTQGAYNWLEGPWPWEYAENQGV